jgi:predicted permease
MSALLLLVFCLVLGVLVARSVRPPATLSQGLNWWVINIAFSALVVHLIPTLRFDWQYWFLVAALWLVFLGAWAGCAMLGRALHWSRRASAR